MTEGHIRLREITERLKKEIYVELDRRIRETEDSLGEQLGEQVEGEVSRQVRPFKRVNRKISNGLRNFQENLQLYHKIPYAIMVIMGFMLFWYGSFTVIRAVPLLSNGIIALIAGMILLFISGAIYKKLI